MKRNRPFKEAMFVVVVAVFILACGGGAIALTPTPAPPPATNTIVPRPTSTLRPTATDVPPTPTAAPMGMPVSTEDYEVNVISMRMLETVYLDAQYHWVPTAGNMFVELGIKVVNLKPGSTVSVAWGNIVVIEDDESTWYPNWGEFKPVASGIEVSPKSLVFRTLDDPAEEVTFDDVVFIRAIYGVARHSPTTILFGFGNAPLIEVVVP
jgi:hypothetical protein